MNRDTLVAKLSETNQYAGQRRRPDYVLPPPSRDGGKRAATLVEVVSTQVGNGAPENVPNAKP